MSTSSLLLWALAAAPVIGPSPGFKPPVPEVVALASGARAWVVSTPGLPLVHVAACVPAGSLADPQERPGLALLTATAVEEGGAGDKGPAEVLAAFDAQGTELEVTVGELCTTYTVTTLTARLEPVLAQLVDVLARPRFDTAAFESAKRRQLAELSQASDQPPFLAQLELRRRLFGSAPPGHIALGEAAALARMTVADARRFHEARYGSAGITFVVTGDVTAAAAKQLLDKVAPKPWLQAAPAVALGPLPAAAPAWVGVERPGLPQTVVLLGRAGVVAGDAAVPALELASTVLGGSFTSRLNQNLREAHGYTYGAGTELSLGKDYGLLAVRTSVRADVTGVALKEVLAEMKGLRTLSAAELAKARALQETALVSEFETGRMTALHLVSLLDAGLPFDHSSRKGARRAGVTPDQAVTAASQFEPAAFVVVLVGDRALVEKQLAKEFPGQAVTWVSPR
jgi:zinc protease